MLAGAFSCTYTFLVVYVLTDTPANVRACQFYPDKEVSVHRGSVDKGQSARAFKSRSSKTNRVNVATVLRGGIRL